MFAPYFTTFDRSEVSGGDSFSGLKNDLNGENVCMQACRTPSVPGRVETHSVLIVSVCILSVPAKVAGIPP